MAGGCGWGLGVAITGALWIMSSVLFCSHLAGGTDRAAVRKFFCRGSNIYVDGCSKFFISGNFYFSVVSISLAYIEIPKHKGKTKITWD